MPETREEYRSFTVRVPMSRYLEMSQRARRESKALNATVNELLTLGLGGAIQLDEALARLIRQAVVEGENR
jgi:hypothetical protein